MEHTRNMVIHWYLKAINKENHKIQKRILEDLTNKELLERGLLLVENNKEKVRPNTPFSALETNLLMLKYHIINKRV